MQVPHRTRGGGTQFFIVTSLRTSHSGRQHNCTSVSGEAAERLPLSSGLRTEVHGSWPALHSSSAELSLKAERSQARTDCAHPPARGDHDAPTIDLSLSAFQPRDTEI